MAEEKRTIKKETFMQGVVTIMFSQILIKVLGLTLKDPQVPTKITCSQLKFISAKLAANLAEAKVLPIPQCISLQSPGNLNFFAVLNSVSVAHNTSFIF